MSAGFDPRLVPARADIAADFLDGKVNAARFVRGRRMRAAAAYADLRRLPRGDEGLDTQLLHGEIFTLYEEREGWAWGQAQRDSYVGYVAADALVPEGPAPSHVLAATQSLVFPAPDLRHTPLMSLSLGARVRVVEENGHFARLDDGGFMALAHLVPLGESEPDYVRLAERLIGVPYLWGGRTSAGLDCSGLVQLVLQRAGIEAPRDTDLQEEALGTPLPEGAEPSRGDLVFWVGHVGLMADSTRLIHANGFHMAVGIEPLAVARARIQAAGQGVTSIRRL
jgi:cell wall-associated NlpC family hydrolase